MDVIIETPPATDDPQDVQDAPAIPETMERLAARHSRERVALGDRVTREQRDTEAATLAAVLDELRRRLRTEHSKGELYAVARYGTPSEVIELQRMAAEAAPGQRPPVVMTPDSTVSDGSDRRAWAFVEVSDVVWK